MSTIPKIKYTLVGFNNTILVDYFEKFGEFVNYVSDSIYPKIKKKGQILWSSHHVDYLYIRDDEGLTILVMLETGFNKELALNYIYKVQENLLNVYSLSSLRNAPGNSLIEFRETLKQLSESFNINYTDKSKLALNKAISTQNLVVESLANLLDRSNRLDEMKEKVENMSENSVILMRNATGMRRRAERRYCLSIVYMLVLVLFVIYIILVIPCGLTLSACF